MIVLFGVTIGAIAFGHYWFKMRDTQKEAQSFATHLIDTVAALAMIAGWIVLVGIILSPFFTRR